MRQIISITIILIITILFVECTAIQVTRHPDYYYPPNPNPKSIRIYAQGLYPNNPFVIIGLMNIDATWTVSEEEATKKVCAHAASIGGEGVIITDTQIDIVAFNRSVTTRGTASFQGNQVNYYAVHTDNTIYVPIVKMYAYVIRWTK